MEMQIFSSQRVRSAALAVGCTALALIARSDCASADAISDFYSGKSLNLVIGYAPGGGYDVYARTLARHMTKHVPGNPAIVVQNMPGAGSIKAANFLYAVAPKDGLTFGNATQRIPRPASGPQPHAVPVWRASTGSAASRTRSASTPFRTGAGIKSTRPTCKSQALCHRRHRDRRRQRRVSDRAAPDVLRMMKVVAGYRSAADVVLAIQRKREVDDACGWSWRSRKPAMESRYVRGASRSTSCCSLQRRSLMNFRTCR